MIRLLIYRSINCRSATQDLMPSIRADNMNKMGKIHNKNLFDQFKRIYRCLCLSHRSPCSAVKPLPKINPSPSPQSGAGAKRTTASSHTHVQLQTHDIRVLKQKEINWRPDDRGLIFQENGPSVPPESSEFGLNVSSIRNGAAAEATVNRKVLWKRVFLHISFVTFQTLSTHKQEN